VFARVAGALLEPLGIRHGDHVALERTDRAEHGDLAAVVDGSGRAALWRVYPEGDALRLSTGDPAHARRTGPSPRIQGVVVGVLRKWR
jgi:SOS-response transcriptional repressor LexA